RVITYHWTPQYRLNCFDCPQPYANPQATNKYKVQVTDVWGCRNEGEITVVVVCNDRNFTIPNTFSPNGDGVNEVFYPKGTGLIRIKSLVIFNRWGEMVFDKKDFAVNDPAAGWNGMYKGQKASADVYVYRMEIICENNEVIPVQGNITLLR
ncbi:MAG TPA: gliding motility-associated C-terminal domain-containing protein, partial [Chitinophagaceae bacterium]|nr:gliding motility-associated C-terminal domain-containing protein [Chitinophagaceae bacterium]